MVTNLGELVEAADKGGEEEVGDLGGEFEESWSTRTTRLSVPPRPPLTWMAGGEVAWGGEVLAWCWSSDLDLCRGFLEDDVEAGREPRSGHNSILFTFHNPGPWKKSAFFNKRTMKVCVSCL